MHALTLAYVVAVGCGNLRAPLILGTLVAESRALSLLSGPRAEEEWSAWVLKERRVRLGLMIFTLDASGGSPSFSLDDVANAQMPDGEQWLATEEAWRLDSPSRQRPTVGEAYVTTYPPPASRR